MRTKFTQNFERQKLLNLVRVLTKIFRSKIMDIFWDTVYICTHLYINTSDMFIIGRLYTAQIKDNSKYNRQISTAGLQRWNAYKSKSAISSNSSQSDRQKWHTRCWSNEMTLWTHSSTLISPDLITSSQFSGSSYDWSMPVKPLISPRRAFLYSPLGSRLSQISKGAFTKHSKNANPASSCSLRASSLSCVYNIHIINSCITVNDGAICHYFMYSLGQKQWENAHFCSYLSNEWMQQFLAHISTSLWPIVQRQKIK